MDNLQSRGSGLMFSRSTESKGYLHILSISQIDGYYYNDMFCGSSICLVSML